MIRFKQEPDKLKAIKFALSENDTYTSIRVKKSFVEFLKAKATYGDNLQDTILKLFPEKIVAEYYDFLKERGYTE